MLRSSTNQLNSVLKGLQCSAPRCPAPRRRIPDHCWRSRKVTASCLPRLFAGRQHRSISFDQDGGERNTQGRTAARSSRIAGSKARFEWWNQQRTQDRADHRCAPPASEVPPIDRRQKGWQKQSSPATAGIAAEPRHQHEAAAAASTPTTHARRRSPRDTGMPDISAALELAPTARI